MQTISKGILGIALAAATSAAAAQADDPLAANITVHGSAPLVCSLGGWTKDSGAGSFSGGTSAVVTYSNSDLVDGEANSVLGPAQAVALRAQLLCNTSLTWTLEAAKGALRLDSSATVPGGFSNQWLYHLEAGPKTSGGAWVGFIRVEYDSEGEPISGISSNLSPSLSTTVAYFALTFTPLAQSARMMAGNYSESITLTVSPSL